MHQHIDGQNSVHIDMIINRGRPASGARIVEATNLREHVTLAETNALVSIQFSPDGINQDSTLTRYYRTNQINVPHRFTMTRRYCRIVVTNNSGTDQTYLRLQTAFSGGRHPLNVPLDGTVAQDYDATVVRPTDYHYEVAEGLRQVARGLLKQTDRFDQIRLPRTIRADDSERLPDADVQIETIDRSDQRGSPRFDRYSKSRSACKDFDTVATEFA